MRNLNLLVAILISSSSVLNADEFAVVTGQQGFLIGEKGEIVEELPYLGVAEVLGEDGEDLLVRTSKGSSARLSKRLVHRSSWFAYLNNKNVDVVAKALQRISQIDTSTEKSLQAGIRTVNDALKSTESAFENVTPGYAWILAYRAYLEYSLDELETAHETLDTAESILEELGEEEHLQAAEILNTRGLVRLQEGRHKAAIKLFNDALLIVEADLGSDHIDVGTIRQNLAGAYSAKGDHSKALRVQKLSTQNQVRAFPEQAFAVALSLDQLGVLAHNEGQYELAADAFVKAIEFYSKYHPDFVYERLDARLTYGETLQFLERYDDAERQYQSILADFKNLDEIDIEVYHRDVLNRLGVIDFKRQNYLEAKQHFIAAQQLADEKHPETIDGLVLANLGNTHVELNNLRAAKAAYQAAITAYAASDGADSDSVREVKDLMADLDVAPADSSFDQIALVTLPRGFLERRNKTDIAIPGLTVLDITASGDRSVDVRFRGQSGTVPRSQLRTGSMIPGYGEVNVSTFRECLIDLQIGMELMQDNQPEDALDKVRSALDKCREAEGANNTLWTYLKCFEVAVIEQVEGTEAASEELLRIRPLIKMQKNRAYPIQMDADSVAALLLNSLGEYDQAVRKFDDTLRVLISRVGNTHADVVTIRNSKATAAFSSQKLYPVMLQELQSARTAALAIFPSTSAEVIGATHRLALGFAAVGRPRDAISLLERTLARERQLAPQAVAETKATLARVYLSQGDHPKAPGLLEDAHKLYESGDVETTAPMVYVWQQLAAQRRGRGDFRGAEEFLMRTVQGLQKLRMDQTFDAAEAFRSLAELAMEQNNTTVAGNHYRRTLEIYEVLGGGDSPQAADIRGKLQSMGSTTSSPTEIAATSPGDVSVLAPFNVLRANEFMLIATQRTPVKDGEQTIMTVDAGTTLWSLKQQDGWHQVFVPDTQQYAWVNGEHVADQAQMLTMQIVETAQQRHAGSVAAQEKAMQAIAAIQLALSAGPDADVNQLAATLEEALQNADELLGGANFVSATIRSRLAELYQANQQFIRAREIVESAIEVQEQSIGPNHPLVADNLIRLSAFMASIGDIQSQADALERAYQIMATRLGPEDSRSLILQLRMANSRVKTGDTGDAEKLFRKTIARTGVAGTKPKIEVAFANLMLGMLELNRDRNEAAAESLKIAMDQLRSLGSETTELQALSAFALGSVVIDLGETTEALQLLDLAESLTRKSSNDANRLNDIGFLRAKAHLTIGELDTASRLAEQHFRNTQDVFGAEHIFLNDSLQLQAVVAAKRGNLRDAIRLFDDARRRVHGYVQENLSDLSVEQQTLFLSHNDSTGLNRALSLALIDDSPEVAEATVTWLINAKNLATELAARDAQVRRLLDLDEDVRTYEEWLQVRRKLNTLPPASQQEIELFQLDEYAAGLKKKEQNLFRNLPRLIREELRRLRRDYVSIDEIRAQMADDEVLIEIAVVEQNSDIRRDETAPQERIEFVAWIVPPPGKGQVKVVSLGQVDEIVAAGIELPLNLVQDAINSVRVVGEIEASQQLKSKLQAVMGPVWSKLESRLPRDSSHLIISADGELHRFPWAALPIEDDRYLIEKYSIRYVSSGRDLLRQASTDSDLNQPIVFADPNYGSTVDSSDFSQLRSLNRNRLRFDSRSLRKSFPPETKRLKATAEEAQRITPALQSFAESSPVVFLRDRANEAAFRAQERPHTAVISTHGFFIPVVASQVQSHLRPLNANQFLYADQSEVTSPLQRCGLFLAGCDSTSSSSGNDGILTGEEIVFQDLRGTKLVVLSACETGIGDVTNGQGVAGLRQAFQLAGAESVVSTLWSIDDRETTRLMSAFFENLARGQDKATALRNAQISRIEARRNRNGDAHPFFWAAFTVTGMK